MGSFLNPTIGMVHLPARQLYYKYAAKMLTFDVGTKITEKLVIGYIFITKNLNDEKKRKRGKNSWVYLLWSTDLL